MVKEKNDQHYEVHMPGFGLLAKSDSFESARNIVKDRDTILVESGAGDNWEMNGELGTWKISKKEN